MLVECFIPIKQFFLFLGGIKTLNQHFGANLKKKFDKFCCKFVAFLHFFSFSTWKTLEIKILTSVWNAQHPNAGRNTQQVTIGDVLLFCCCQK